MMMLSKLKVGLAALLSAGFVAGGSGMFAAQGPGDKPVAGAARAVVVPPPAPTGPSPAVDDPFRPRPTGDLARARIEKALERLKTHLAFYEEGRITIDRLIDASRNLMQARLDAATAKAGRVEAVRVHYDRIKEILKREEAELEIGRATQADVDEVKTALLEAEFVLARELEASEAGPAVGAAAGDGTIRARRALERAEVARQLLAEAARMFPSELPVGDYLAASKTKLEADLDAAASTAERQAAIQAQLDLLDRARRTVDERIKTSEMRQSDARRVRLAQLDAELAMAREKERGGSTLADLERRLSEMERKLDRLDAPKR